MNTYVIPGCLIFYRIKVIITFNNFKGYIMFESRLLQGTVIIKPGI
jgi:hypothetical protein